MIDMLKENEEFSCKQSELTDDCKNKERERDEEDVLNSESFPLTFSLKYQKYIENQ